MSYRGKIFLIVYTLVSVRIADAQWIPSTGAGSISCFTDSGSHLYAGTSNGLEVSTDHGVSWQSLLDWGFNGGTPQAGAVAILGANIFVSVLSESLLANQGHGIIRSSDGGFNWLPANGGLSDSTILSFAVVDNYIFASTPYSGVFRSSDSGEKWFAVNNGLHYTAAGLSPDYLPILLEANGNNLYATTDSGVFISTNLGQDWSSLGGGITGAVSKVAVSGSNLIATSQYEQRSNGYYGANMLLSSDFGSTWSVVNDTIRGTCSTVEISTFSSNYDLSSLFFYRENLFASISGSQCVPSVMLSTDLGTSWTILDTGIPDRINSAIVSGPNLVIGGTFGVWYRPLSDFGISAVRTQPTLSQNLNILANPLTSTADFQFSALQEPAVFELFDALGRSVFRSSLPAGQASLHVDMQQFPAGIYFARLGGESLRFVKL